MKEVKLSYVRARNRLTQQISAFYPLPPVAAPESAWRNYASDNLFLINRHFRNWLAHQSQQYTMNELPGGSIIYDPTVSDSKNEARWQTDNIMRIEHSMLQYFQPEDYRIVTDVMIRRYRYHFQHELEQRHFFDETMNPHSNVIGLSVRQFQSRCLVRDIVFVWPDTVRSMRDGPLEMARVNADKRRSFERTFSHSRVRGRRRRFDSFSWPILESSQPSIQPSSIALGRRRSRRIG